MVRRLINAPKQPPAASTVSLGHSAPELKYVSVKRAKTVVFPKILSSTNELMSEMIITACAAARTMRACFQVLPVTCGSRYEFAKRRENTCSCSFLRYCGNTVSVTKYSRVLNIRRRTRRVIY